MRENIVFQKGLRLMLEKRDRFLREVEKMIFESCSLGMGANTGKSVVNYPWSESDVPLRTLADSSQLINHSVSSFQLLFYLLPSIVASFFLFVSLYPL